LPTQSSSACSAYTPPGSAASWPKSFRVAGWQKLKGTKKRLRNADCKIGKVKKIEGATAKTGKVVKQNPKPGKVLAPGTEVKVTLG